MLRNAKANAPHLRRIGPFFMGQLNTGHSFLPSRGIRGHPFPKTPFLEGIRFKKMGIHFSKTPFLEGIKRMQLLLLKLKKATQQNTHFAIHTSAPSIHGVIDTFRILQRLLSGLVVDPRPLAGVFLGAPSRCLSGGLLGGPLGRPKK